MQVQVDIGFDQLVQLAKKLPVIQWSKLKEEVDNEIDKPQPNADLVTLLLSAPTFNKKQLDEIAKTRKGINQWRTK